MWRETQSSEVFVVTSSSFSTLSFNVSYSEFFSIVLKLHNNCICQPIFCVFCLKFAFHKPPKGSEPLEWGLLWKGHVILTSSPLYKSTRKWLFRRKASDPSTEQYSAVRRVITSITTKATTVKLCETKGEADVSCWSCIVPPVSRN